MASNTKSPNTGTSQLIEDFLINHIGESFTAADIRTALNLPKVNTAISSKLSHLVKQGRAEIDTTATGYRAYKVLPAFLNGHGNKTNGHKQAEFFNDHLPTLTPQAHLDIKHQQLAKDAPALDISATLQQISYVNDQNKILRNALESIALILDQAGIIETDD